MLHFEYFLYPNVNVTSFVLKDAHHSVIDGNEVIVDYYRQKLMPGWIPRRLGLFPAQVLLKCL
jgi:hypothetical protein